jgi:UDP-N-acetylglucosamine 2-epimerase (non-hydrolysing)
MADENLRNEGVASEKIHFVGNTMIDTLRQRISRARQLPLPDGLAPGQYQYAVLTLHRSANVDHLTVWHSSSGQSMPSRTVFR